jgi:hypothetical protein
MKIKICENCNKEFTNRHIYDAKLCDELWDTENGVTMCHSCHTKTDNYGYHCVGKEELCRN